MGEIFSKFWMFQKGFVIVFYQVKCFFCCDIECHPINLRIYPRGFPGLNWRRAKIFRWFFELPSTFIQSNLDFCLGRYLKGASTTKIPTQGFKFQPMKLSGATTLGCLVVFCDCLCPTGCEHWTSTRAIEVQWEKRSTASTVVQVELEDVVFVISGSGKRVLPVLPRAYFEWQLLMLHEKSTCSTMIRMVLP